MLRHPTILPAVARQAVIVTLSVSMAVIEALIIEAADLATDENASADPESDEAMRHRVRPAPSGDDGRSPRCVCGVIWTTSETVAAVARPRTRGMPLNPATIHSPPAHSRPPLRI